MRTSFRYMLPKFALLMALPLSLAGAHPAQSGQAAPPQQTPEPELSNLPSARELEENAALQDILSTQRPEDRLEHAQNFLVRYPDSPLLPTVHLARAEAYRMLRNLEKAAESAEAVLNLEPDNVMARILLADALAESVLPSQAEFTATVDRAERYAREALDALPAHYSDERKPPQMSPEDFAKERDFVESQPHATLGYILLRKEKYAEAELELERSIELNQISPNGSDFLRLSFVLIHLQKWDEAAQVLDRAFEFAGPVAAAVVKYRQVLEAERAKASAPPSEEQKPE